MKSKRQTNRPKSVGLSIVIGAIILLASIACQIFNVRILPSDIINSAGIACQVITALVCCVASIIGISFTVQDTTLFGITIKDFRALRDKNSISIHAILIISISLIAINLAMFLLNLLLVSFGVSIIAIAFCLYTICKEVPLLEKQEKTGFCILKSWIASNPDMSTIQVNQVDEALGYLIVNKNIKTTYYKLNYGKNRDAENKQLVGKLLDLLVLRITLLQYEEKTINIVREKKLLCDNLVDIVSFSFDITDLLGEDQKSGVIQISQAIIGLSRCGGIDEISIIIRKALATLDYHRWEKYDNSRKKDFLVSLLVSTFSYAATNNVDAIYDAFLNYYSGASYYNKNNSSLLFFLLSMYLYYLCEQEPLVPADIKNKLRETVQSDQSHTIGKRVIYSWKQLYLEFLGKLTPDYYEFKNAFLSNLDALEYILIQREASWVAWNFELAFRWYIANLLANQAFCVIDYSDVFGEDPDDNTLSMLKRLYWDCFPNGEEFERPEYIIKVMNFYGVESGSYDCFIALEKTNHSLFSYLSEISKKSINEETAIIVSRDDDSLAEDIKKSVSEAIAHEWGLDANQEYDLETIQFSLFVEKSDAINFSSAVSDAFRYRIFSILRRKLNSTLVTNDDGFLNQIKKLLQEPIIGASSSGIHFVPFTIEDEEVREKYKEKLSTIPKYQSSILPYNSLVLEKEFTFNCIIDSVTCKKPNEDMILRQVERYKRADGQYVYESTFVSREEVYSAVKARAIVVELTARYFVSQESRIVEIKLNTKKESITKNN